MDYVKKDGLLYSEDEKTIIGVDEASGAFSGTVPYGAEAIEDEVFSACPYTEISLPDSLKELGVCLFENSMNLKQVKLPTSIELLPPYLFSGCEALEKIAMPSVLPKFSEGLFKGCAALKEIPFRAGIQEIPESCMEGCTGLESIVFPDTVFTIGKRACADCSNLTTVVLPAKMYELADDAFEGCNKIRSIRIAGENHLFYVNEADGCLYERSIEGDDKLRLAVVANDGSDVQLYEDENNLNTSEIESFFTDEKQYEEIDETCSPEITGEEDDSVELGATSEEAMSFETEEVTSQSEEEDKMPENNGSDIDDLFADIMGAEKERTSVNTDDVAVSEQETAVLSEMMDVMSESTQNKGASVSADELANLFASHEETANDSETEAESDPDALDSKTQILIDSVSYSKVVKNEPHGEIPEDPELYVIAEKLVDVDGTQDFSEKLEKCCKKIARIHDFTRVIMLNGLPLDNDEFMQFYHHFINKKNVILACEAPVASKLSGYCKTICEESRISLDKDELAQQRKCVSIKSDILIKLVIQDI